MKKIINGKKYDTDTAKCLASVKHSRDYYADLYRKVNGEYFLVIYGIFDGDREDFIVLSATEAAFWAENNCNDKYEEIFGEIEE